MDPASMRRRDLLSRATTATALAASATLAGCADLLDPVADGSVVRNEFDALSVEHAGSLAERQQGGMSVSYFLVRVTLRNATDRAVSGPLTVRVRFFVGDERVDEDAAAVQGVPAGESVEQRLAALERPEAVDRYEVAVVGGTPDE